MNAMGALLFASDIHLNPQRGDLIERFVEFLRSDARECAELYILGDLFDFWHGDDEGGCAWLAPLVESLQKLAQAGIATHFMRGNRDFLVGERFCQRAGMTLLADPCVIEARGRKILLSHGDLFCTRDRPYQLWRRIAHNRAVQGAYLALPLSWRRRIATKTAQGMRAGARRADPSQLDRLDAVPETISRYLSSHPADLVIHGHTHRPAVHRQESPRGEIERVVLGDWPSQDNVCALDATGIRRYTV